MKPTSKRMYWSVLFALVACASVCAANPPAPTEQHQELEAEVGVWDAETKMWMEPESKAAVGKAIETNTMFGEAWLLSDFEGEFAGFSFQGHGQFGYDPIAKKYVGTWIDTMSPYLSVMEGERDPSGKLIMLSKGRDPATGNENVTKLVSTMIDDDHKKFEMYAPVPGQQDQWWKMMEVHYTRRK